MINDKQEPLNRQQNEYQTLFEESPCYITVQDRDLKLLKYNREFERIFAPEAGNYCFKAYKGRSEKCPDCPVIKTFEDGQPHLSEEQAVTKDGIETYWLAAWVQRDDLHMHITADSTNDPNWKYNVGFVPTITEQKIKSADNAIAIVCGPPIMIKFTQPVLEKLGFPPERIILSLKCA